MPRNSKFRPLWNVLTEDDPHSPERLAAEPWTYEMLDAICRETDEDSMEAVDCPNCGVVSFAYKGDYVCIVCRDAGVPPKP